MSDEKTRQRETKDQAPSFERELAVYESRKSDLEKFLGQYVVICGETLIGPYATYSDAYTEGHRTFGDCAMLIKQILDDEPVSFTPMIGVSTRQDSVTCRFTA